MDDNIGVVSMDARHVITLQLRAEGDGDGILGDALLEVKPGDLRYEQIIQHVGGLEPGQTRPVPPFSS